MKLFLVVLVFTLGKEYNNIILIHRSDECSEQKRTLYFIVDCSYPL